MVGVFTLHIKCPEVTVVVMWSSINKTELNCGDASVHQELEISLKVEETMKKEGQLERKLQAVINKAQSGSSLCLPTRKRFKT